MIIYKFLHLYYKIYQMAILHSTLSEEQCASKSIDIGNILLLYNNVYNLSSGHRNRLRRRNKNNYNRVAKDIIKCKNECISLTTIHGSTNSNINLSKNIDKLTDKLEIYSLNIVLIDNIILELSNTNKINNEINEPIIVRYNNGQIVPFGSMDYLILTNR